MKECAVIPIAAVALLVGAFAPLSLQTETRVDKTGAARSTSVAKQKGSLNAQDRQFIKDASASNLFEVRSSQGASSKQASAWTKEFASTMVRDHGAAQKKLAQIAKNQGVNLDSTLPRKQSMDIANLTRLNGPKFDSMYRTLQISAHKLTVAKLQKEIKSGSAPTVREYASKMLPIVQMHLKMVQNQSSMSTPRSG